MNAPGRISVTRDGPVAVVTLDRPQKANALTADMVRSFAHETSLLDADPAVRAIVLTGAGERAFCAGGDLDDLLPAAMDAADDLLNPDPTRRFLSAVFTPVIAAVRGACFGAGFEMLLGTDLRIASTDARFGLPETGLGLIPGDGTHVRLPQQVPWPIAMELLLVGAPMDAPRALALGIINETVAPETVLPRALELASRIAANGPLAVRTAKEIAVRARASEAGFALEHALNARVLGSADAREGVRAFHAKQPPVFTGK